MEPYSFEEEEEDLVSFAALPEVVRNVAEVAGREHSNLGEVHTQAANSKANTAITTVAAIDSRTHRLD